MTYVRGKLKLDGEHGLSPFQQEVFDALGDRAVTAALLAHELGHEAGAVRTALTRLQRLKLAFKSNAAGREAIWRKTS